MSIISYKCPNCGAPLAFTPNTETINCGYCKSSFELSFVEDFNKKQMENEEEKKVHVNESDVNDNINELESDLKGYTCNSCGAEVLTDDTTSTTFCYYCHNHVIIEKKVSGTFKPDKIIPFKIDKKVADEYFKKWIEKKYFVKNDFKYSKQKEKITGIYFPFWMIDSEVDVDAEIDAKKIRTWTTGDRTYTETKEYKLYRKGNYNINNVKELAIDKIDKKAIESITPFNEQNFNDFTIAYLVGFFTESRNIEKEDVKNDLETKVGQYSLDILNKSISSEYSSKSFTQKNLDMEIKNWYYVLLPTWTLVYRYLNNSYIYTVNGETGTVHGEIPLDKKKLLNITILIFVICSIVFFLGGVYIW